MSAFQLKKIKLQLEYALKFSDTFEHQLGINCFPCAQTVAKIPSVENAFSFISDRATLKALLEDPKYANILRLISVEGNAHAYNLYRDNNVLHFPFDDDSQSEFLAGAFKVDLTYLETTTQKTNTNTAYFPIGFDESRTPPDTMPAIAPGKKGILLMQKKTPPKSSKLFYYDLSAGPGVDPNLIRESLNRDDPYQRMIYFWYDMWGCCPFIY